MNRPVDPRSSSWYSVLGVQPDATVEQITAAVERLMRQANALSVTAPDRARQMRDQVRAIRQDLLAGADRRQRYDQELAAQAANGRASWPAPQMPQPGQHPGQRLGPHSGQQPGPHLVARISRFLQAGWTCATCGYGALPTDKFCPKCGSKIQPEPGSGAPRPLGIRRPQAPRLRSVSLQARLEVA